MERKYYAQLISQRESEGLQFVTFTAYAKDIKQWAGIRRVGEHEQGHQRIRRPARVKAIKQFFEKDPRNIIPTSIVLAFLPKQATFQSIDDSLLQNCLPINDMDNGIASNQAIWGILHFQFDEDALDHEKPALVVDGQHRLEAMSQVEESLPLHVVALINATAEEQAFQFVVINNKSAKVKTENVKAIIAVNEQDLQARLAKAGVNYQNTPAILLDLNEREDSPFHGLLDWPLVPNGIKPYEGSDRTKIKLTTIEGCLRYLKRNVEEIEDDEDTQKEILISLWNAVADSYQDLWKLNDKFMTKVNINALNELLVDRLSSAYLDGSVDIFESHDVNNYASEKVLVAVPQEFWEQEWTIDKLQDNTVVRNLIKTDLEKITRNSKSRSKDWNEGLKLVADN